VGHCHRGWSIGVEIASIYHPDIILTSLSLSVCPCHHASRCRCSPPSIRPRIPASHPSRHRTRCSDEPRTSLDYRRAHRGLVYRRLQARREPGSDRLAFERCGEMARAVGVSLIYLGTIKLQPRTTIPILSRILSFPCDPRRQTSGNSFSRQSALLCSAPADHANSHSTRSPRMVKSTLAVLTTSTHPPPPTSATMATVSLQTLLCATIV